MFTKQPPFHPAEDADLRTLISAGVAPYSLEQCSGLDDRILKIARPMISFEPSDRPAASEILSGISKLLYVF